MGLLLMNMAQISMILMKTMDVIAEMFKVIIRTAILGMQALTIFSIWNGSFFDQIRNAIQSFMVG